MREPSNRNSPGWLTAAERALTESMKPSAAERALMESMRPSAAERALMDSLGPSAVERALMDSLGPSAVERALMESMRPSAAERALMESMRPSAAERALMATQPAAGSDLYAFVPPTSMITSACMQLAHAVAPLNAMQRSRAEWQKQLSDQMSSLHQAWVLNEPVGLSMFGYACLSRISEAVRTEEPYSEEVSALINNELGAGSGDTLADEGPLARDVSAVAAGLKAELIAFPPTMYSRVLLSVGLEFQFSIPPVPQAIEGDDPSAAFDPIHCLILLKVEQSLRLLIEKQLRSIGGAQWVKRRVSEQVRSRWEMRQDEDRKAGRPVYDLVQYADFMDLAEVITQKNNWHEVFQAIFQKSDDFSTSLKRLHPVRKAIAHSRPLGRADVLTLMAEATRILGALERDSIN